MVSLNSHRWRVTVTAGLALLIMTVAGGCEPGGQLASDGGQGARQARLTIELPSCDQVHEERRGNFVRWVRDGASIVFYWSGDLYRAAADGSALRLIETAPEGAMGWHAFDVSPDGQQVVYSACGTRTIWGRLSLDMEDEYYYVISPSHLYYGLVRARIDGSAAERLRTGVVYHSAFPSWSPDGARIAIGNGGLETVAADGSDPRRIAIDVEVPERRGSRLTPGPLWTLEYRESPQWSPDSQRLAVTAERRQPVGSGDAPPQRAVYTVGADGSDSRRLVTGVVSGPTWSPDGRWLAYARVSGGDVILAIIRADGTDERYVATIDDWGWANIQSGRRADDLGHAWIRTVAWSPDGAHLLYSCGPYLCVVATDGRPVGRTPEEMYGVNMGTWSPDGSRIAVTGMGDPVVYTMAPDGGQWCPLVVARHDRNDADSGNAVERLWRRIFGPEQEAKYPLVAVRDCEAGA